MITKSKQNWAAGQTVKVGFLSLRVICPVPTPGDYMPDAYVLANLQSTKLYKFIPHNGLTGIDLDEANEMIASAKTHAARIAAAAMEKAAASSDIAALFA